MHIQRGVFKLANINPQTRFCEVSHKEDFSRIGDFVKPPESPE